jgi:hypothetical protein
LKLGEESKVVRRGAVAIGEDAFQLTPNEVLAREVADGPSRQLVGDAISQLAAGVVDRRELMSVLPSSEGPFELNVLKAEPGSDIAVLGLPDLAEGTGFKLQNDAGAFAQTRATGEQSNLLPGR